MLNLIKLMSDLFLSLSVLNDFEILVLKAQFNRILNCLLKIPQGKTSKHSSVITKFAKTKLQCK